jgi:hypothetical protein
MKPTGPRDSLQASVALRRAARAIGKILALALTFSSPLHAATHALSVVNSGASAWVIDGQNNPTLTLVRGDTYQFNLQAVPGIHPFYIKSANSTGSGNQFTQGVTNNGATGSTTITFIVPAAAPDALHYNCGNHSAMNGSIAIIDDDDVVFIGNFE